VSRLKCTSSGIEFINGRWVVRVGDKNQPIIYLEADGTPVPPPSDPETQGKENE